MSDTLLEAVQWLILAFLCMMEFHRVWFKEEEE